MALSTASTIASDGQSPGACLRACADVLAAFDRKKSLERDMEKMIAGSLTVGELTEVDKTIASGCAMFYEQHNEAIKTAADCFYKSESGRLASRGDYFTFCAIMVLAIHRQQISFQFFSQAVMSTKLYRTTKFMEELFQVDGRGDWLKSAFCQHFDEHYVTEILLAPLEAWREKGRRLVQRMRDVQSNKARPAVKAQPATEPKPFKLTESRRHAPSPEPVQQKPVFRNPVPKSTHEAPSDLEELAAKRYQNRVKAESTRRLADLMKPACARTEKSQHAQAVLEAIKAENDAKLQFSKSKLGPVPKPAPGPDPKRNAATIMREGARLKSQEMEEAKRVAELAAGGMDDQAYREWKRVEDAKELERQLRDIERKHLEGQLSFEQALIAQEHLKLDRHSQVTDLKAESEDLLHQLAMRRLEQEEEMRRIVEETIRGHENAKDAREKVQQQNQEIAKTLERENEELLRRAREQARLDHEQRVNLIMDIRAMERVPIERFKEFDRMTTGNHGLLLEMSVAELQERVAELKVVAQEDERKRRAEIDAAKRVKDKMLEETEAAIRAHHAQMLAKKQLALDEAARKERSRKEPASDPLSGLKEQLNSRKAERQRLREEFRSVSTQGTASGGAKAQPSTKPLSRGFTRPPTSGSRSEASTSLGFLESARERHPPRSLSAKQRSHASRASRASESLFPIPPRVPIATKGRRAV